MINGYTIFYEIFINLQILKFSRVPTEKKGFFKNFLYIQLKFFLQKMQAQIQIAPMTALSVDAYQKLSDIDHILLRPDMWIGPIERIPRVAKCLNLAEGKIVQKQVLLSEGEEQTFVEIIGNVADNVWRSREHNVDPGSVEITMNTEWIIVKNYGMNIPVARKETGEWVPGMIFGNLRTSSNYDDTKKRYLIGKNGIGAKATNVLSKIFMIECADPANGLLYRQTWQNNMKQTSEPEITPYQGPGYTQIAYSLDFARFGVQSFDQEAVEIYAAHCAAVSYTCSDENQNFILPVIFNGQRFAVKNIFEYANYFHTVNRSSAITYKDPHGTYDLCIIDTPDNAVSVSFVNGIVTSNGGVHADAAYRVVVKAIVDFMGKSAEGIQLTKRDIVNHVSLFISCRIANPKFKSQVKDTLSGPEPKIELPEALLKGIRKWHLIETIYMEIQRKQMNKLKKTDGKRKKRVRTGGAEPANLAGGPRSMETTLILTEGLSADSYRLKFISQIPNGQGRNFFGSLPLHGKLLNVLNADFMQIVEHRDLNAIKDNLGLKEETDYNLDENCRKLNYGNVLFMADPDNDGKHILGLFLLFMLCRFPGLVERGFIKFLRIPVVRIDIDGKNYMFYSMTAFKRHMAQLPSNARIGKPDYFKGLGSSEDHHIKQDFINPRIVTFKVDEVTAQKILLAFHKTASNLRKQWIADWVNRDVLDTDNYTELPISIFIDHEFVDYSIENIIRSIPEAMDGMKESQRKAYFAAMRKLGGKSKKDKVKVAQIASHAAEITCYKHGETCLSDTIVQMTYAFTGANNMAYFHPKGQFGTRNKGGKDAANPRYTCVSLPWWYSFVYRKEDKRLEKRIIDEGEPQECENLFPTLPMHVINGVIGIGTAYSTNIPQHNPLDVAFWLQMRLLQDLQPESNHQLPLLRPWYKGFTGQIVLTGNGFTTEGKMRINMDQSVIIEELPIGTWTKDYEDLLDELEQAGTISGFDTFCTDEAVKFVIYKYLDGAATPKKLKLISKHSYNNMTVLYRTPDRGIQPRIYNDLVLLLQDFYTIRLAKYVERKALMLREFDQDIHDLSERARFIHTVAVTQQLEVRNRPEAEIYADMTRMNFNHDLLDKVKTRELNKDRIPLLLAQIDKKTQEKAALETVTPQAMWFTDLEEFIVKYCREEKCQRSTIESCNPVITLTLG